MNDGIKDKTDYLKAQRLVWSFDHRDTYRYIFFD